MNTVNRKALKAFTHFVPGYGQVHGNPEADDAKVVKVPVGSVDQLVAEGKIGEEDMKPAKAVTRAAPAAAKPQGDGDFAATYTPVGKYEITGPGLSEPEIFKGNKAGAEARIAELRQAALDAAGEGAGTASDEAPAD